MNIVITAGGTTEHIDPVRAITNTGTGTLSSIIADEILCKVKNIDRIFYIHTTKAKKPKMIDDRLTFIEVEDTNSVAEAVKKVLTENKIDYFIHAMAISDYYVDFVTTVQGIVDDICADDNSSLATDIMSGKSRLDNSKKLSSNADNLVVMLKKTPKIIGMIKDLSPETHLIGFKLLNNVSEEELVNVAYNLLKKNDCDYVVANDATRISEWGHDALFVDTNGEVAYRPTTNIEIARVFIKILENQ